MQLISLIEIIYINLFRWIFFQEIGPWVCPCNFQCVFKVLTTIVQHVHDCVFPILQKQAEDWAKQRQEALAKKKQVFFDREKQKREVWIIRLFSFRYTCIEYENE